MGRGRSRVQAREVVSCKKDHRDVRKYVRFLDSFVIHAKKLTNL